jgi:large subunit ribosomal protein L15e
MGAWKYIRANFQKEWKGQKDRDYNYAGMMKQRTLEYRNEDKAVVKLDGPTNIPAARSIGYKAKQGVFVARVRVRKGTGTHHRPKNKRRPKRQGQATLSRRKSVQAIAEERASKRFENAEVLGSYKIAEDGMKHYYEVVLADRDAPGVLADKNLKWINHGQKGRAERGKTFFGRVNKRANLANTRKRRRKQAMDHTHG